MCEFCWSDPCPYEDEGMCRLDPDHPDYDEE